MATNITMSEVLAELELATKRINSPDDAPTITELQEETGWGSIRVRATLREAKKAGRLQAVRVMRENLAGYMQPSVGYRILPAKKSKR